MSSETPTLNQRILDLRERFVSTGGGALELDEGDLKALAQLIVRPKPVSDGGTELSAGSDEDPILDSAEMLSEVLESVTLRGQGSQLAELLEPEGLFSLGQRLRAKAPLPEPDGSKARRRLIHELLNLIRQGQFLEKIASDRRWDALIRDLLLASAFDVRALFEQRLREYGSKVLFKVLRGDSIQDHTWSEVGARVAELRRGLRALLSSLEKPDAPVAFLMENSLNTALVDLACLTGRMVNVIIPANAPAEHVALILNETMAPVIVVSSEKQLAKLRSVFLYTPHLEKVVTAWPTSRSEKMLSLDDLVKLGRKSAAEREQEGTQGGRESGSGEPQSVELEPAKPASMEALATVMYTSGTTGRPKGIMFSYLNLVYKRFCRALALPKLGPEDCFVCFLPLYHTFGRFLEMMGCVFWAANYVFLENPSMETIVATMRKVNPSVFISIPKKWQQLYDYIASKVNLELAEDEEIREAIRSATGERLSWGLSAAGFLPPEVFRFFQEFGIELMSGFGMTEATGGITMTPPGKYRERSIGCALPGMELKLAEDGELWIRGAYVMTGYYGSETSSSPFKDGWLPTGDIMHQDAAGFIEIVDRKKDIYKNSRGETIAPQRPENYLHDLDSVHQAFLVGDHRPFNTLLICPNWECEDPKLAEMSPTQIRETFSSLVVSVNKFLMPYERIVDFRLVDRPFSLEKDELTPKGTFKRRVIVENFKSVIEPMYAKNYASVIWSGIEFCVPNWYLRESGCLSSDVKEDSDGIYIPKLERRLPLRKVEEEPGLLRIGDYIYRIKGTSVDLQELLTRPLLWIGNRALVDFVGPAILVWLRPDDGRPAIHFHSAAETIRPNSVMLRELRGAIERSERSLWGIHLATEQLRSEYEEDGLEALDYLQSMLQAEDNPDRDLIHEILKRPRITTLKAVQREMLALCISGCEARDFRDLLDTYLSVNSRVLNSDVISRLQYQNPGEEHVSGIEHLLVEEARRQLGNVDATGPLRALFELLADFGSRHPAQFKLVRQILVRLQLQSGWGPLVELARRSVDKVQRGFRSYLGENKRIAVDVEDGREYSWKDVVTFSEAVPPEDRERILAAISETCLLRESVFLLSGGIIVDLNNIPRGGVWVQYLGAEHGKSVSRLTVHTRFQGSYDLALNLNQNLTREQVQNEINWLIVAGDEREASRLVEDFGGYWEAFDLWSEEYVAGETVQKYLKRVTRRRGGAVLDRFKHQWPYFVWDATEAYLKFARQTGYRKQLQDPSPLNIVIPLHDYQTGTRIVSISNRTRFLTLRPFIEGFHRDFVLSTEEKYPFLKRGPMWKYIFAGVMEAVGESAGVELLQRLRRDLGEEPEKYVDPTMKKELDRFLEHLGDHFFMPKRLYFAVKRFHRWMALNKDAELSAQARTLKELYDTYALRELEQDYPAARPRFFLETVFEEAGEELLQALRGIVARQHETDLTADEALSMYSSLQEAYELSDEEQFFLTRMSYPYLQPEDTAHLLRTTDGGTVKTELAVQLEDDSGVPFIIRGPISPKEISRLQLLFIKEKLNVEFRPEHLFLIAVSERGHLVGGLFYHELDQENAHMEKLVVSDYFRRKGVGVSLMGELFSRLRNRGFQNVSTGFFRPEFFYRLGFKVGKRYAGLVRDLNQEDRLGARDDGWTDTLPVGSISEA